MFANSYKCPRELFIMSNEIERKFLIKKMPNLDFIEPVYYQRYFLFRNTNLEIRIQKRGGKYEFERKVTENNLSAKKLKFEITKEEYDKLKELPCEHIVRESYKISDNPEITVKVYHGKFEGLVRAEVEFEDEKEAQKFQVPEWFGEEITNSSLGRDSKLLDLSKQDIKSLLR